MSLSHFFEKKRWILGVALGFLATVLPLGVFAEGPKGTVWVADEKGNSVTVIDAATNKVVKTITGIMGPHNVQVAPDGKTVSLTGHGRCTSPKAQSAWDRNGALIFSYGRCVMLRASGKSENLSLRTLPV